MTGGHYRYLADKMPKDDVGMKLRYALLAAARQADWILGE